jgi:cytochrome b
VNGQARRARVWDLPTRIFHWSLATLVVFSFTTGKIGGDWMAWHLRSGYTILALVLFRIAWGFVGSETARFTRFVRGPRAALAHGREVLSRRHAIAAGHTPLGGWMIVAMLAATAFQASTGLFSDDEIATQGPLAVKVSNALVSRMSSLHAIGQWIMVALVALHVSAIAFYRWGLGVRLVAPMVTGWSMLPAGEEPPAMRPAWIALGVVCACASAVWWLVEIFPMR